MPNLSALGEEDPPCTCHGCGRKFRVDVNIPDELWREIRPDPRRPPAAGLLCGPCIMERIEAMGQYGAYDLTPTP